MIQDNETLQKIMECAIDEFLENGYMKASLRMIVKKAGVTTGAFYRYFASKEELFNGLVDEVANNMIDLYATTIHKFEQLSISTQTEHMIDYSKQFNDQMIEYIYHHFKQFKLLICCSKGTKYEDFIHRLVMIEEQSTLHYIQSMRNNGYDIPQIDLKLIHMISSGLFDGMFEMIRHDMTIDEAKVFANQLFLFHAGGWSTLMNIQFL